MRDIFAALGRSVRSLARAGVFVHLIWPGIVSVLLWVAAASLFWTATADAVREFIRGLGWAAAWAVGVMPFMVTLFMAIMFMLLIYVTSAILVSTVSLPLMLERVARRDYADLERRHGGSSMGSIGNSLVALLRFALVMAVSLPLWLIPGVALVAPVLAAGWLNQRIFGYDALMIHADRDELVCLPRKFRSRMWLLGAATTLLAYVPVVNIVASAFSGLAFVHFLLEALRRERKASAVEAAVKRIEK